MILFLLATAASANAAPKPADVAPQAPFSASTALDPDALNKATAREDLQQVATADQAAQVSGNTINGPSVTGTVSVSGNAFQNLQGLSVISVNSGNNVAINSALNVNVQFTPAP